MASYTVNTSLIEMSTRRVKLMSTEGPFTLFLEQVVESEKLERKPQGEKQSMLQKKKKKLGCFVKGLRSD